ncbi:MAG: dipicolinate synthase subunit B [Firmicutes bacterium]|nr:dipicolinate synthase subunit B [Bacillota bacterium]
MKGKTIGFGITGSYCTFATILPQISKLVKDNTVIPIFSASVANTDTRFYSAADFFQDVMRLTGRAPITSIVDAEPIGPSKILDVMVIAPCTGNSLAKLANSITDTPVLMAAKAHIRNDRPLVLGVSTNDALSGSAKNIGALLNYRNVFFIPMAQDDPAKKTRSVVADFSKTFDACEAALRGKQLQPVLCLGS